MRARRCGNSSPSSRSSDEARYSTGWLTARTVTTSRAGPHLTPVIDIRTDTKCARTQVREMARVPKVAAGNIREVPGGAREAVDESLNGDLGDVPMDAGCASGGRACRRSGSVPARSRPCPAPRASRRSSAGDEVLPQRPLACADTPLAAARVAATLGCPSATRRSRRRSAVELGLPGLRQHAVGIDPGRVLDRIVPVGAAFCRVLVRRWSALVIGPQQCKIVGADRALPRRKARAASAHTRPALSAAVSWRWSPKLRWAVRLHWGTFVSPRNRGFTQRKRGKSRHRPCPSCGQTSW